MGGEEEELFEEAGALLAEADSCPGAVIAEVFGVADEATLLIKGLKLRLTRGLFSIPRPALYDRSRRRFCFRGTC